MNVAHSATAALVQKLNRNRTLSANEYVSEFISTVLQPSIPLTYYTTEPTSSEGEIRNRLTSCKSFSGRASELVTGLLAIIDLFVAKPSRTIPTVAVDEEEEGSEGENGPDNSFFKTESSDHGADDDGWESGSINSENGDPSAEQAAT